MNPEQHRTIALQLEATLNEQQRLLYHRLRQLNYRMIPTAFTGIAAALLIGGGQTLHTKFRTPIPTDLNSVSRIQADSEQAQQLRECKYLRRQPNVPFGGKVMLFTGDLRKCAPVSDNENIEASKMCIKRSNLWTQFRQMALQENVQADPNEKEFKEWLMEVGDGRSRIFGESELRLDDGNWFNNAILCPTNKDALEINTILTISRGPNRELLSNTQLLDRETDQVVEEYEDLVDEFLRRTPHGFPPHILNLKVGELVMLLKN
ncbi:unnamed protein product [Brachionus calyciflorus]|uniref:ATP-dependent DNA helicase n=1 Tax=Brachionus calyciflorus TaxID=104777 RepID=A0A814E5N7_9BILA|nr:unnamed protein product [Brachionus calyciflorus]